MGFVNTNISLPSALLLFCLPKKGTLPNASARNPARPSLGKEASALFYWLVLRTLP